MGGGGGGSFTPKWAKKVAAPVAKVAAPVLKPIVKKAVKIPENTSSFAKNIGNKAGNAANNVADRVGGAVHNLGDNTKDLLKSTGDLIGQGAVDVGKAIYKPVAAAAEPFLQVGEIIGNEIQDAFTPKGPGAGEAIGAITSKFGEDPWDIEGLNRKKRNFTRFGLAKTIKQQNAGRASLLTPQAGSGNKTLLGQ